jgi:hypothetical protein
MYLEIAFAAGVGLLVSLDPERQAPQLLLIAALALVAEAIVFTFTRAGLLTVAVSLAIGGASQWMRHGFGRATRAVFVLALVAAIELLSSRSLEMMALRLTTKGRGAGSAPCSKCHRACRSTRGRRLRCRSRITNTGRATWDSDAAEPIKLSYHWIAEDSDDVIAWEGIRTLFDRPFGPERRCRSRRRSADLDGQADSG